MLELEDKKDTILVSSVILNSHTAGFLTQTKALNKGWKSYH